VVLGVEFRISIRDLVQNGTAKSRSTVKVRWNHEISASEHKCVRVFVFPYLPND